MNRETKGARQTDKQTKGLDIFSKSLGYRHIGFRDEKTYI